MKKLLIAAALLLSSSVSCFAQDLGVTWSYDDSTRPATGFRIWEGSTLLKDVPNGSARDTSFTYEFSTGTHNLTMTAYDDTGESVKSIPYSINIKGEWGTLQILNITIIKE